MELPSPVIEEYSRVLGRYRILKSYDGVHYQLHHDWTKNLKMNLGIDAMMKRLGNLTGQGYASAIGVGDSTAAADANQTDLQAPLNKFWKSVNPSTDINYVRPVLFVQVNFGFTEANYVWNELALRDNNNVMWARQIDGTPLTKVNTIAATVEWQLSLT